MQLFRNYNAFDVLGLIETIENNAYQRNIDLSNLTYCRAININYQTIDFSPKLVKFICKHFSRKYNINMECAKHEYDVEGEVYLFFCESK